MQVGEARQDGVGVLAGQVQQRHAQRAEQRDDVVDLAAQPQADVGRDLVIARAARVQALAGIADQRGQARLDVQVDVFQVQLPFEAAGLDFALDLRHAARDLGAVGLGDDALLGQHGRMRQRPLDVEQGPGACRRTPRRCSASPGRTSVRRSGRTRLRLSWQWGWEVVMDVRAVARAACGRCMTMRGGRERISGKR
ncbi:hypothetical protein ACTMU2_38970 [Cupriavidus basilensis]